MGVLAKLGTQGHDALPPQHTQGSPVEFPREEVARERERGNFLTSLDVLPFTHKILSHDCSLVASGSG